MAAWILVLFLSTLAVLAVASEAAFRLARRLYPAPDQNLREQTNMLQGALLGLLALMLGFSFEMASDRFETRKRLVLEEANAIGTTALRARLLDEPRRSELAALLLRYIDVRLAFYEAGLDEDALRDDIAESDRLHEELWRRVDGLEAANPTAVSHLFIESLNQVIDLHATRLAALRNRLPHVVVGMLILVAAVAIGFIGFGCALDGRRNLLAIATISILVSAVIALIVDLDAPRSGLIRVSEDSMLDLRDQLREGRAP